MILIYWMLGAGLAACAVVLSALSLIFAFSAPKGDPERAAVVTVGIVCGIISALLWLLLYQYTFFYEALS